MTHECGRVRCDRRTDTQTYTQTHARRQPDAHRHVRIVDPRNTLILRRRLQNFVFVPARRCRRVFFPDPRYDQPSSGTQRNMYTRPNDRLPPNISISCSLPHVTCFSISSITSLLLTTVAGRPACCAVHISSSGSSYAPVLS